ncbi:WD40 repeat-like protein [Epithele typhae]|uniref:WD40 repeat-like protein n=1 Tax=Epithele typhae TaxID=378194 RepID=UPI0020076A60|nr:WD40 repeat-like protein [Epithele typhae]KAH9917690.1 WD40 repeat-like protein [Epithele typhae]
MASSTIYNHKHLQPTGAAPQGPNSFASLNQSFNQIRDEFSALQEQCDSLRGQRDEYENKISSQVTELNIIRQSLYELETQHGKIRQQYEDDLRNLRAELDSYKRRGAPEPLGLASLGRDRELRERERELTARERERERDVRDRDRDVVMANAQPTPRPDALARESLGLGRPPVSMPGGPPTGPGGEPLGPLGLTPHAGPVGLGVGAGPGAGGGYGDPYYSRADRDRERERDRDRDRTVLDSRDRERERDRDRDRDGRDVKRIKTERDRMKGDRPDPFSPSMGTQPPPSHIPPHHHHQSISLGPGAPPPSNGAPPTPSGPPIPQATPKLPPTPSAGPPYPGGPGQAPGQDGANGAAVLNGRRFLVWNGPMAVDLSMDPQSVPPELKNEGADWFAIFNPAPVAPGDPPGQKKRALDVKLVHTLMHESVVCCVRFSADGKYLATGCNRSAQIYDTKTGQKTSAPSMLVDESASKTGDLYIRSVCFSPDGRYLATGAEDKQIRIWDIREERIRTVFSGHQQEIYSLDFSRDGKLIVSGSGDRTARIWDMNGDTSQACKVLTIPEPDSVDAGVTSVCISPDGRLVAAGSLDTVVRIWDVATGILVERLKGHRDSVYSVAFTPDGKGLVSGSLDKTLKYWDVRPIMRARESVVTKGSAAGKGEGDKGGQCTMNFTGHKDYVLSVAVSHDGKWVVSGSKDRGVQFWDANSAIAQCMLQGHKNSVISIDLSPAGNVLATGSGDWSARIWSYAAMV